MAVVVKQPAQIPADAVSSFTQNGTKDDFTHNVTITLPAKTRGGSTGTVTFTNGKISAYTEPT